MSKPAGASQTKAYGRRAGRCGTLPIPRRWPGWPSIGRSRAHRCSVSRRHCAAGARCARAFTPTSAATDSTNRGTASFSTTGSNEVDASLLLIPIVGFLPAGDARVHGTLAAIQRDLVSDDLVARYRTNPEIDALPPGEAKFLPCSFRLVDNLSLLGRRREAATLFSRLLPVRNDVGLLAEEYDPVARRQLGNFPRALTHVALINTARNLSRRGGPSEHRSRGMRDAPPGRSKHDLEAAPSTVGNGQKKRRAQEAPALMFR